MSGCSAMHPFVIRLSNQLRMSAARARGAVAFAILSAALIACSANAPSPTPSVSPTPTPAPTALPTPTSGGAMATGLIVNEPDSFEGYTLIAADKAGPVHLIDNRGRVVHAWTLDHSPGHLLAKLLDSGELLAAGNKKIDPHGNVVWEYRYPQHHDLLELPNGNILTLSMLHAPRADAIDLGANPPDGCSLLGSARIVEIRPTGPTDGEIVWQWSALDHIIQDFDPGKPNYGVVGDHPELIDVNFSLAQRGCVEGARINWLNANALDYNAELDQIMLTIRPFSEIWIIDHSTSAEEAAGHSGGSAGKGGDLLYRWGNPRAYQRGTADDQRLFHPHNAHWIPEGLPGAGNILIFNNGDEHPGFARAYSTVDEFALPSDGYNYRLDERAAYGPNEVVWRYAADPPKSFHAPVRSGAQRLPNGNTLVADGPANRIFEVTREGRTVWEFVVAGDDALYRSYRYAPDYPGIQNLFAPR